MLLIKREESVDPFFFSSAVQRRRAIPLMTVPILLFNILWYASLMIA
jgi:hypothetical protein